MTQTVRRVCTLCEANCGLSFEVEGNRITSVRPDHEDPFSQGYVCPKGMAIAELHDDPDRLRQAMRRTRGSEFEPIGWGEALDLAAAGLARARAAQGGNAVAVYWGNPISTTTRHCWCGAASTRRFARATCSARARKT